MIVLAIVKCIGSLLLVALILLLVFLVYLFFSPFTYHIECKRDEDVCLRFLFHSFLWGIQGEYQIGNTSGGSLRLLWGCIEFPRKKKKMKPQETPQNLSKEGFPEESVRKGKVQTQKASTRKAEVKTKEALGKDEKWHSKGKTAVKTKGKQENGTSFRDVISDASHRRGMVCIIQKVFMVWKHYAPHKIVADFAFSLGEPDTTGYVLGAISCIPFSSANIKRIEPDFESEDPYFQGFLSFVGRIQLIFLLIAGIGIVLKRECRALIKVIVGGA